MTSLPYPTEDIQDLLEEAESYYDDISENAQSFIDDLQAKLDFAIEEEVGNIRLTEKQHSWLVAIANGEASGGDW